jgi:hypothetical protein
VLAGERDRVPHEPAGGGWGVAALREASVRREGYRTRAEAVARVFEDSEALDHRVRRDSAPGYKSPAGYEQAA